jgi:hypothetical protein
VDRYLELVAGRCRPNTLRAVTFDLKTFFTVVGKDPVEVTAVDVFEFLAHQRGDRSVVRLADRESGLSARTIARRLSSVSGMYAYLIAPGWLVFLSGDGVQLPAVVPVVDVPERPDALPVADLCVVFAHVLGDATAAGSDVITLTRSGDETVDDTDRCWFRTLHAAARERGAAIRMIGRATQAGVRQLTLDDAG